MKKKIMIYLVVFVSIVLLTGCKKTDSEIPILPGVIVGPSFTLAEAEADYDQLVDLLDRYNPKLYTDIVVYESLVETQKELLFDGITELAFLRVVAPIVASVNCGHTGVFLSEDTFSEFASSDIYYPIDIRLIDGKLHVIESDEGLDLQAGSEIISINGKEIDEILTIMYNNISSDGTNITGKQSRINSSFAYYYYLFVSTSFIHEIEYKNLDSDIVLNTTIYAEVKEDNDENGEFIQYSSEFEDNYAILTFNSFYPYGEYSLSDYLDFIDEFFVEADDLEIENIILDVRENGGGDPWITSRLFNYLASESQPYFVSSSPNYYPGLEDNVPMLEPHFDGNLYILISGSSFSSTGHLISLLKHQNIGTFIGEESGASFACSDSSEMYTLLNTRLRLNSSKQVWAVDVEGLTVGRGIMPDYEVIKTLDDYLLNEDSVMEYTINLINN